MPEASLRGRFLQEPQGLEARGPCAGRAAAPGEGALRARRPRARPAQPYPPREVLVFQATDSQAPSDVLAPHKQLSSVCK